MGDSRLWIDFLGWSLIPPTLHKYLYVHANPVSNVDPSGHLTLHELNTTFTAFGAFLSGYSIGSGIYGISQENYRGGFIDIGLGLMGTGVLAKTSQGIAAAAQSLLKHRTTYINLVRGMEDSIAALQASGKTAIEIVEWAVKRRNEIKILIRAEMVAKATTRIEKAVAVAARKFAEVRNHFKYGDSIGPSADYLIMVNYGQPW